MVGAAVTAPLASACRGWRTLSFSCAIHSSPKKVCRADTLVWAAQLNIEIFETIYFAACTTSNALAKRDGPYETFAGCDASTIGLALRCCG